MKTTPPSRKKSGFSLVEITIAIGIFSFCLVAIVGLFPVTLNNSESSINETAIASLLTDVNSYVRSATPAVINSGLPTLNLFYNEVGGLILDNDSKPITTVAALNLSSRRSEAYFQVRFQRFTDSSVIGLTPVNQGNLLTLLSVSVEYPYPRNQESRHFLAARTSF